MVLTDNVAGGGSVAEKIQREGGTRSSGAQEKGEKRLRRCVILIHITCTDEQFPNQIYVMNS